MDKLLSLTIQSCNYENSTGRVKGKIKTYRGIKSQQEHNDRTEVQDDDYLINPENTPQNVDIVHYKTEKELDAYYKNIEEDYKNHWKKKMPSNTKKFINGLITFSPTMQDDIKIIGKDKMVKVLTEFIQETYGEVISVSFHMDEETPHFHFQSFNYDFKQHKTHTKILEKMLKDSNNKIRQNFYQDKLENHLHKNEINYDRGEILSIKKFKSDAQKRKEYTEKLKNKITQMENDANLKEQEHTEKINKGNDIIKALKEEIDTLKASKTQLTEDINKITNELDVVISEFEDFLLTEKEIDKLNMWKKLVKKYSKNENVDRLLGLLKNVKKTSKAVNKQQKNRI